MEYLMYLVWVYCFVGVSKLTLVLVSFPAAIRAINVHNEKIGIPGRATYFMHLFAFIVTVGMSLFFWWTILYREGWAFFSVYNEDDVVRDTIQAIREMPK